MSPDDAHKREVLLESQASRTPSASLRLCMVFCAFLLLGSYFYGILRQDTSFRDAFSKLPVGLVCLYASGFRKTIWFAPAGIVRQTRGWFTRSEEILSWRDVRHVILAFRKDDMLALFEKGTMGWKVPCRRRDEEALRGILKEYIPHVEVEVLGR